MEKYQLWVKANDEQYTLIGEARTSRDIYTKYIQEMHRMPHITKTVEFEVNEK